MIELVNVVTGVFGSGSTSLGTHLNAKKKCVDNVYFHDVSYKKSKKSVVNSIVNMFANSLNLVNISNNDDKSGSISNLFDLENMKNMVVKETSYTDLDNSVVKSFTLDIKLLAVPEKSVNDKLISIKKIFYQVDGFGGASAPSKFPEIIRLLFTLKLNLNKAKEMAICEKILVNNNVRKPSSHLNWEIIVKKIPVNFFKLAVESVFFKFGKVSVLMEKDFVCMAKMHWALLYTLLVKITVYDLSGLLASYGRKTCVIGHNPVTYVHNRSTVDVNLHWTGFSLACCAKCKQLSHISDDRVYLANIYKRKQAPITHPVSFGNKTWAQVLVIVLVLWSFVTDVLVANKGVSIAHNDSSIDDCLASLECFLKLLANQVSSIVKKLSMVKLVLLAPIFGSFSPPIVVFLGLVVGLNMVVNALHVPFIFSPLMVSNTILDLDSSSSKVLTAKVGGLKSKLLVLDASFKEIQIFTSGLDKDFFGMNMAVIMNNSLAYHVSKVKKVPDWSKLSVRVLGLYASVLFEARFKQASEVNSLIAKTVNTSTFVVLEGNFNENRSGRSTSFKFCLDLRLVNSFSGHHLTKTSIWSNLRGVKKTINFIFVSENLSLAVAGHGIGSVSDFFDTDHKAVMVSVGLGKFLNICLNSLCKQANKDQWKFGIKDVDKCFSVRLIKVGSEFLVMKTCGDLDVMWKLLEKSSKFFGLELLIAKIVKKLGSGNMLEFRHLAKKWSTLDYNETYRVLDMIQRNEKSMDVFKQLSMVRKKYKRSKLYESKLAKKASIKKAIEKCMESFCSNKGGIIKSILDKPFCKVVLDYLVVDNKLVLDPKEVVLLVVPDHWACQYAPLDYINNNVFSGIMERISMEKDKMLKCLLGLLNSCLFSEGVPKILFKIFSDWILFVYSRFGVLQSDNFLVLKSTSTQFPVFAIGSVVKDALKKNREF
ncbi:hypothetical protein G9A89_018500 [Geosiphon pyriformis]|nr:hypothetical protein G9A89_018500 [Geosiphon pyriformis]